MKNNNQNSNLENVNQENSFDLNSADRVQMNVNNINTYNASSEIKTDNNINDIKERLSIKEPTDNSVYKIDSTLPIEYQNIFISSYIPKNIVSAELYCNKEVIANINDLKKDYIKWTLKHGDYTFYIEAKTDSGETIKSSTVKIYVQ